MNNHADELFIYELYANILKLSKVIDGRYYVAEGYGNDLNTASVGEILTDVLGSITVPKQKYPLALQLAPVETVPSYTKGFSVFRNDIFFLTLDGRNGDGTLKSEDIATRTSRHTIKEDWKDMREVAGNFRMMLRAVMNLPALRNMYHDDSNNVDVYTRISLSNNDRVNGIWLQFATKLATKPCDLADYEGKTAGDVQIPNFIPHALHKH